MSMSPPQFLAIPVEVRAEIIGYLLQDHPKAVAVQYSYSGTVATDWGTVNKETSKIRRVLQFTKRSSGESDPGAEIVSNAPLATSQSAGVPPHRGSIVSVLLTCKQLYEETLTLLFNHTTFTFTRGAYAVLALLALVHHIGEHNAHRIRSIFFLLYPRLQSFSVKVPGQDYYVRLEGPTIPGRIQFTLALCRLTGLRLVKLRLTYGGAFYFYHSLDRPGRNPFMSIASNAETIQVADFYAGLRPLFEWVRRVEGCELVFDSDASEFRREVISNPGLIDEMENWAETSKKSLLAILDEKEDEGPVYDHPKEAPPLMGFTAMETWVLVEQGFDQDPAKWREQCEFLLDLDEKHELYLEPFLPLLDIVRNEIAKTGGARGEPDYEDEE